VEQYKRIDEKIQEGYARLLDNDHIGCCDRWLEAWDGMKELFAQGIAEDIWGLNDKYKWQEFPLNCVQDLQMELHNAGIDDRSYHQKRIVFCQELIRWSGVDELLVTNARIFMAEAHYWLGDADVTEQLYHEWLREDPDWGWGYIGWSDHYRFNFDGEQNEKAEEILLTGYMRESLRNKTDVVDRLVELYGIMGKHDKVKEFKRILNPPLRVVKIGRNDPCPCNSGKKYKKCCGAMKP